MKKEVSGEIGVGGKTSAFPGLSVLMLKMGKICLLDIVA